VAESVPSFSIAAAVSGRAFSDADLKGDGVVVVHGAKTSDAAKDVSRAVRATWANNEAMLVASIVDLRAFSGLFRRIAEAQVKVTYNKLAAKAAEAGLDPAREVLICPDWDGAVCATLGVPKPDEVAVVLVVKGGRIVERLSGADLAKRTVAALA
jgi:hypothetical protein